MGGKNLVKPQAESRDIGLEEKESNFCDQKQKAEKLTIEELRCFKGFETVSESEGQDIIESLFRLAVILNDF
ncbi:hypothetical protein [Flavobacterium sp. Root420]|uniref:hypothetical protein n=1 Tax=Flavobacterium sp. Root420 TaxID=1736533 RepID=UPI0006FC9474|nr:hypothetical protein [Flavobacterium sp. Root420]KQW99460.1 hypothetical protein ASC72_10355 [Flavobacterium sp. Root420]